MSTITLERLPNTVSGCHAEIRRLREATADGVADEVANLKEELSALKKENDRLEERIEELEDADNPDAVDAINRFLDEVDRPAGALKFDVLHGPSTDRAIVGLFDAAGRNL